MKIKIKKEHYLNQFCQKLVKIKYNYRGIIINSNIC